MSVRPRPPRRQRFRRALVRGLLALVALAGGARAEELRAGGTGGALGLLQRLAPAFAAASPGDQLRIQPSLGSGGGIAAVRDGVIDLAVSARPLNAAEQAAGLRAAPWISTPLVAVTARRDAPGLARAMLPDLYAQANPTWPDGVPLRVILRPPSEASIDLLIAAQPALGPALRLAHQRRFIPVAPTDQDNFIAARATPGSLTFAGLAQLLTEGEGLFQVPLDGAVASLDQAAPSHHGADMPMLLVRGADPAPVARRFVAFLRTPAAATLLHGHGARTVGPPDAF
jgi:phosphate transport system substrate-binding protein